MLDSIRKESVKLRTEIRERTLGYIVTALGLVAGLAWNEAVKALIEYFFPLSQNSLLAKFIYALIITIIIVVISAYLLRLCKKEA